MEFDGELNDKMKGFYRSKYTAPDGLSTKVMIYFVSTIVNIIPTQAAGLISKGLNAIISRLDFPGSDHPRANLTKYDTKTIWNKDSII